MKSTTNIRDALSRLFLFEALSPNQLQQIETFSSLRELKSGDMLFVEDQPATAFFYVVTGQLKIYKLSADGNEQILHIQKAGDLLAEAVIFEFDRYPAYCQAVSTATLIRIAVPEFKRFLRCSPDVCFEIMGAYSRRIRQLVIKIEELSLHDIKARLANFILTNSREDNGRLVCRLPTTKRNLAALLGTIPETLSRTLQYFKGQKLITEKKNDIIIIDRNGLKQLSGPKF